MDLILGIDYELLYWINIKLSNGFFDIIMPMSRNKFFWAPVYLFLVTYLLINYPKVGWKIILSLILLIALSDQISSGLLKPIFNRVRPCNAENIKAYINVLIPCGVGKSMPSSHAANHFALATYLSIVMPDLSKKYIALFFIWAFLVSYAQVYVGVHFPLDVMAGGMVGIMIALGLAFLVSGQFKRA